MNIDSYVIHLGIADYYRILVTSELWRILRMQFDMNYELEELVQYVNEKGEEYSKIIIEHIVHNEKYKGASLVTINAIPLQIINPADNLDVVNPS
jgi:hypothetical protein